MSINLPVRSRLISPARPSAGMGWHLALRALPWLADREVAPARLVLIPVGFLPVTLIAAAAFGVGDLRELTLYLLLPALALVAGVLVRRPAFTRTALGALAAGVVATALYDAYRGSFLGLGLMQVDPIPHIGVALHLDPAWVFGYLWRYLGNGGGMAVAFFALGFRGVRSGIAYGLFVCSGLLLVLVAAPYGQEMLFPLNAATVVMAVGGHVIYGAALGWIAARSSEDRASNRPVSAATRTAPRHSRSPRARW